MEVIQARIDENERLIKIIKEHGTWSQTSMGFTINDFESRIKELKANQLDAEVDVKIAGIKREIKLQECRVELAKIAGFVDIIYYAQKRADDLNEKLSNFSD